MAFMPELVQDTPLVFVADDDRLILELIETRLRLAGYATAHAREGWEAVHRIHELRPRAIILDVNMPGLDGFEVLKTLRSGARPVTAPVMMLTARNAEADIRTAIKLGARDFMTKPFEDGLLLARVARLLKPPRAAPPARTLEI
jgi:two-component system OmpR family response regulator